VALLEALFIRILRGLPRYATFGRLRSYASSGTTGPAENDGKWRASSLDVQRPITPHRCARQMTIFTKQAIRDTTRQKMGRPFSKIHTIMLCLFSLSSSLYPFQCVCMMILSTFFASRNSIIAQAPHGAWCRGFED